MELNLEQKNLKVIVVSKFTLNFDLKEVTSLQALKNKLSSLQHISNNDIDKLTVDYIDNSNITPNTIEIKTEEDYQLFLNENKDKLSRSINITVPLTLIKEKIEKPETKTKSYIDYRLLIVSFLLLLLVFYYRNSSIKNKESSRFSYMNCQKDLKYQKSLLENYKKEEHVEPQKQKERELKEKKELLKCQDLLTNLLPRLQRQPERKCQSTKIENERLKKNEADLYAHITKLNELSIKPCKAVIDYEKLLALEKRLQEQEQYLKSLNKNIKDRNDAVTNKAILVNKRDTELGREKNAFEKEKLEFNNEKIAFNKQKEAAEQNKKSENDTKQKENNHSYKSHKSHEDTKDPNKDIKLNQKWMDDNVFSKIGLYTPKETKIIQGMRVKLLHWNTKNFLNSSPSSHKDGLYRNQLVTGDKVRHNIDNWFILENNEAKKGIYDNDIITLRHYKSNKNVFSDMENKSAISNQIGVIAIRKNKNDKLFNWKIELEKSYKGDNHLRVGDLIRLVNEGNDSALHSHEAFYKAGSVKGQQEIIGHKGRDINDLWIIVEAE